MKRLICGNLPAGILRSFNVSIWLSGRLLKRGLKPAARSMSRATARKEEKECKGEYAKELHSHIPTLPRV
jgi:hypothetical protein